MTYCGGNKEESGEDRRRKSVHQVFLSDLDYLINQNRQKLGTPDESAAVAPET
jgi:hypothetical protein